MEARNRRGPYTGAYPWILNPRDRWAALGVLKAGVTSLQRLACERNGAEIVRFGAHPNWWETCRRAGLMVEDPAAIPQDFYRFVIAREARARVLSVYRHKFCGDPARNDMGLVGWWMPPEIRIQDPVGAFRLYLEEMTQLAPQERELHSRGYRMDQIRHAACIASMDELRAAGVPHENESPRNVPALPPAVHQLIDTLIAPPEYHVMALIQPLPQGLLKTTQPARPSPA